MKSRAFAILFGTIALAVLNGQTAFDTSFLDFCAAAVRTAPDSKIVKGLGGWLFYKPELEHLAKRAFWGEDAPRASAAKNPAWADPLPAILDFNEQLKRKGIALILLPVPAKAVVYPDMLGKQFAADAGRRLDHFDAAFYTLLRGKGVKVVDLLPLFLARRRGKNDPLYCLTDTHWSPAACEIAAAAVGKEIQNGSWHRAVPKLGLVVSRESVSLAGDLAGADASAAREKVSLRVVRQKSDGAFVTPRDDSPVVLMGDSHTLVFHAGGDLFAQGAGLADELAFELGFPVDLIGVRGSGSTAARVNMMRKAKNTADYLSGKKVVIWCFSVREFTESPDGWRLVPIVPGS